MELVAWYEGVNMGRVLIWKDGGNGMLEIRGCLNGELLDMWRLMDIVLIHLSMDELATSYAEAVGIELTQESYERSQEYAALVAG